MEYTGTLQRSTNGNIVSANSLVSSLYIRFIPILLFPLSAIQNLHQPHLISEFTNAILECLLLSQRSPLTSSLRTKCYLVSNLHTISSIFLSSSFPKHDQLSFLPFKRYQRCRIQCYSNHGYNGACILCEFWISSTFSIPLTPSLTFVFDS